MIFLVGLLTLSAVCVADNSTGDFTNTQIAAVEDNSTVGVSNFENEDILSDDEGGIDATETYECVNEYRAEHGICKLAGQTPTMLLFLKSIVKSDFPISAANEWIHYKILKENH
jgi:hypothetical protein